VWRQLRKLGAVYLQNSVCLLPDTPAVSQVVNRLAVRVRSSGGHARVLHVHLEDRDAEAIVAEQRGERDGEYAQVMARTPALLDEIRSETVPCRTTYAEVAESHADLARFDRWLDSITARDYFDAQGGQRARAAVEACRDAFAAFETAALAAEYASDALLANPLTRRRLPVVKKA
jgi:sirohydrochlorin ferrochelatase